MKAIPGFSDYMVNEEGEFWSMKSGSPKRMKTFLNERGYKFITLRDRGQKRTRKAHRLVALTFLGPSDLDVNHKNGIKTDNRLSNLEYATRSENMRHAVDVLGRKFGVGGRAKAVIATGAIGIIRFSSLVEAVQRIGGDHKQITKCCKGQRENYRGFTWQYS